MTVGQRCENKGRPGAGTGTEGSHPEPQAQNRESELGVAWIFKDFKPTPLEGDTLPSKAPQTVPPN